MRLTCALVLLSAAAAVAHAESGPYRDNSNRFEIALSADYERDAARDGLIASFTGDAGTRAVISRVDYPNTPAWRKKRIYYKEIERGVRAATPDYRKVSARAHRIGRVPVFDLEYRRKDDRAPRVMTRFLLFRTYTLILSIELSDDHYRKLRRSRRSTRASFVPYFGR